MMVKDTFQALFTTASNVWMRMQSDDSNVLREIHQGNMLFSLLCM